MIVLGSKEIDLIWVILKKSKNWKKKKKEKKLNILRKKYIYIINNIC